MKKSAKCAAEIHVGTNNIETLLPVVKKKFFLWGRPGGAAVQFPHSASVAWGLQVQIPGADMALLGKPCCGRRPTYIVEEDGHRC